MSDLAEKFEIEEQAIPSLEVVSNDEQQVLEASFSAEQIAVSSVTEVLDTKPKWHKKSKSKHSTDALALYIDQLDEPLLTKEDEIELAQTIEKGKEAAEKLNVTDVKLTRAQRNKLNIAVQEGAKAKQKFFVANLRLPVSIAKRYPNNSALSLLDRIQEGNLGLEHAIEKFDWRKGFKFSTYATYWIRQRIGRAIAQSSVIRLPNGLLEELQAAYRAVDADDGEISERVEFLRDRSNPLPLDTPLNPLIDVGLNELIPVDEDGPEEIVIAAVGVAEMLAALSPIERDVLILSFGLDGRGERLQKEIAKITGMSIRNVSQIKRGAIKKLQEANDPLSN